ncbi:MAG: InlB B-repeat-containing protein, partial [Gemmatirosa sp.]
MRDTRRGRMVALLASALVLASCDPDGPTAAEAPSAAAHRVQITIAGDGVGTVSATPSGLSCATGGSGCAASVAPGSTISLTASAGAGSTFGGWTGPACGSASVCVLTVDAAQTVTATFVRAQTFTLGVTTAGAGAGDVASAPAGIACARGAAGAQSGTCEATFAAPTAVTLTATPVAGSTFAGWSGTGASACGSAAACTVAMSAARSVTATFAPSPVALTVVTTGAGAGTVGSTPVGVDFRRAAARTPTPTS